MTPIFKLIFKIVSFLEGISYILLMFIGMPYNHPEWFLLDGVIEQTKEYVQMLGMPHGILFIAYIILAIVLKFLLKWTIKEFGIVCLLSLLPFGTFFVGKYLKEPSHH